MKNLLIYIFYFAFLPLSLSAFSLSEASYSLDSFVTIKDDKNSKFLTQFLNEAALNPEKLDDIHGTIMRLTILTSNSPDFRLLDMSSFLLLKIEKELLNTVSADIENIEVAIKKDDDSQIDRLRSLIRQRHKQKRIVMYCNRIRTDMIEYIEKGITKGTLNEIEMKKYDFNHIEYR